MLRQSDFPRDIASIIARCIAEDPKERPESAAVLLAELNETQNSRERGRQKLRDIHIDIPESVGKATEQLFGLRPGTGLDYLKAELNEMLGLSFTRGTESQQPDLRLACPTVQMRLQPHSFKIGFLRIQRVIRPNPQQTETARTDWYRPTVAFRYTSPSDSSRAAYNLDALLEEIQEADLALSESDMTTTTEFLNWRQLLRAKFDVEDNRAASLRYTSFSASGNRITFALDSQITDSQIGESRLVRSGRRSVVFGDIEAIGKSELVLYLTKGKSGDLPTSGTLELDTEASKSKIRREQYAFDRLTASKTARTDLKELLLDPSRAAPPQLVVVDRFINDNLDETKKEAIRRALGARDFLVVQGPPGTGKTTFIAELVAQTLAGNPDARILIASQTHIALDNALARIKNTLPSANLLRIGRADQLTAESQAFSMEAATEYWRDQVKVSGTGFIKQYARALGINLEADNIPALVNELSSKLERISALRSKSSLHQARRRKLQTEIEERNKHAAKLIEGAQAVEALRNNSSSTEIDEAVQRFVSAGVEAAAGLESSAALTEALATLESSLAQWRNEISSLTDQQAQWQQKLARTLDLPVESTPKSLLEAAAAVSPAAHPQLVALRELAEEWNERFGSGREFQAALLASADIVGATCVGLGSIRGAEHVTFDLCIVDEASKATASETLVPLVSSKRWILVGDQNQLPPFVEHVLDSPALLQKFELEKGTASETMFDKLVDQLPGSAIISLTHQHRMHPAIGTLISKCFYNGGLTSASREGNKAVELAFGAPVLWFDTGARTDRRDVKEGHSFRNRGEVRSIVKLVDRLQWTAQQVDMRLSVAVLTGYEAQRRDLEEALATGELSRHNLDLRIANVDAYQGQESDVAIFSVTRSNDNFDTGFIGNNNRINVALSRARDGLIVVGDTSFIDELPEGRSALQVVLNHVRINTVDCKIEMADED